MSNNIVFRNVLHHITTDFDGMIMNSDNTLFSVNKESNITDFHPIFLSALPLLIAQDKEILSFPGLSMNMDGQTVVCDVTIKKEIGFIAIVFFNFTNAYELKQEKIQAYNEQEIKRQLLRKRLIN